MNERGRPVFFYLFPDGNDFRIAKMTDSEALELWNRGMQWVDVAPKTLADAQELRAKLLAQRRPED